MNTALSLPQMILGSIVLIASAVTVRGVLESKYKANAFRETLLLYPLGIFVWGDAVVFGFFWSVLSLVCLVLSNLHLFFVFYAAFWLIRSMGETHYWMLQQFSQIERNPPQNLRFHRHFNGDSIWFVYQTFWQCVSVVSLVALLYLAMAWIG